MGKVILEGMEFFAYHGVSDEEQKIGNKFSIDVIITTNFVEAAVSDRLRGTVNYDFIYKSVAKVMKTPIRLLEHIGYQIIQEIRQVYPNIENIEVHVSKFNPPVGGVCTKSKIIIEG